MVLLVSADLCCVEAGTQGNEVADEVALLLTVEWVEGDLEDLKRGWWQWVHRKVEVAVVAVIHVQ